LVSNDSISYTCDAETFYVSLTPNTNEFGNATISITITDGSLSDSTSFALTVNAINDAPIIGMIPDQITNEEIAIYSIPLTVTDSETAGCSLDISIVSSNTNLVADHLISYTCGTDILYLSLTPTSNQSGNAIISITITDGSLSDATSFALTVNAVNDAPVLTGNTEVTLDEDRAASFSITATDAETAGCSLSITYRSSDITLLPIENISKTCMSNEFSFMITPIANQSGNALLTITVADTSGLTATKVLSLTVNAVNDIPIIDTIDSQSMNEGTSISVTMTASDIEGSLTLTGISADQSLIPDSNITITNSGNLYTITITPDTAQAGSTELTIIVSDGTDIITTSFTVSVNEVYYTLAGHVSNYTDISGTHIAGVTMTLSGTHTYTTFTDISGDYTFSTVRPGDYTLTASKTDDISLDLSDAIHILKASVGLESLSCYEKIAADASMNGSVTVYDAAKVAQYVVGNNNCFNDSCVFWRFIPEIITNCETWTLIEIENVRRYTELSGDVLGQDFIGIGCGSVVE